MNPQVKAVEYAVRGPIVLKAGEIELELQRVTRSAGPAWGRRALEGQGALVGAGSSSGCRLLGSNRCTSSSRVAKLLHSANLD